MIPQSLQIAPAGPQLTFTVLMSVYKNDRPGLFGAALKSIFDNSIQPNEVVLVIDGEISAELRSVVDSHLHRAEFVVLPLPHNVGLAKALNAGLAISRHPYVFRADADDINLPDRFAKQLARLQEPLDLIGGAIQEVGLSGQAISVRRLPSSDAAIRRFARKRNPFNHMTVAYRRDAVLACGGYPDVHLKEDYALWAAMLGRGARVANMDDILVRATAGKEMYARRGGLRYVQSEVALQRTLVACGLQSWPGAVLTGLMRSAVFLMPASWRGLIYEKLLRRPAEGSSHA